MGELKVGYTDAKPSQILIIPTNEVSEPEQGFMSKSPHSLTRIILNNIFF